MPGPVITPVPWRFIVTNMSSATITLLDRLAATRQITTVLNGPTVWTSDVPSDNPEINIIYADTLGDPFVSYGNRLVYGFRQEGYPSLYVCRFGGLMTINGDDAATGQPYTHLTAANPWQRLYSLPIIRDDGTFVPPGGWTFNNVPGSSIAIDLLTNATAFASSPGPSPAGALTLTDFGQSGSYGGTINVTDPITVTFQQQDTLGDAFDLLAQTNTMDFIFKPIYDPILRPGYIAELSVFKIAGSVQNGAIFAWDMPSRSLVGVNRLLDGTQLGNRVVYFLNDGTPLAIQLPPVDTAPKYGQYFVSNSLPGKADKYVGTLLALAQSILRSRGKNTISIDPAPERSPVPFLEYDVGDWIPVYASKRLRAPITPTGPLGQASQRVYGYTVDIADDVIETVSSMLIADDVTPTSGTPPPPPPPPPAPSISYVYDGVTTVTISIPPKILVGLAADDVVQGTSDDGSSEATWPNITVTADPVGTYGAAAVLTIAAVAYDGGTDPNYFVTPRDGTNFRVALLVPAGTDAGAGTLPDLSTFSQIGPIVTFTYGTPATLTSPPFSTLPIPLPLPTGGGGGGGGGSTTWGWDATVGSVDPNSNTKMAGFATYAGTPGYLVSSVAVQNGNPATDPLYTFGVGHLDPNIPIPAGTIAGHSFDETLVIVEEANGREHSMEHAVFSGTWSVGTGSSVNIGSTQEPNTGVPNDSSTASRIPVSRGIVTPSDIGSGSIDHTLCIRINEPQIGPPPCPYPANTTFGGPGSASHVTFGNWIRLKQTVNVAGLGLPPLETMICYALQRHGAIIRDGGSQITVDGLDPSNQGGQSDWNAVGVVMTPASGLYSIVLTGIPWDQCELLLPPPPLPPT